MIASVRQARGIAGVSLLTAALLVAPAASSYTQSFAAGSLKQLQRDVQKVQRAGEALAKGTLKDGPTHTWDAIKKKPLRYGAMLAGIGAIGAGAKWMGVDPEPFMIALSAGTLGFSLYKSWPLLKRLRGTERARAIGAHVVWPSSLAIGSTGAGIAVGQGHGPAAQAAQHASLAQIGKAGAQSVLIGIDVPTIAQTALDPRGDQQRH